MQASKVSAMRPPGAKARTSPPFDTDANEVRAPAAVRGCTCFRVRRLARRVTQIYDRVLAPSGIRVTQFSLLSALARNGADGGALAVGSLAAALDMDRTTLTRNLKPLIDVGLVSLVPGKADARRREAKLTRTGRLRYEEAKKLWRRAQDQMNRTLGMSQVASLHRLFDGLLETLDERRPDCSAESAIRRKERAR